MFVLALVLVQYPCIYMEYKMHVLFLLFFLSSSCLFISFTKLVEKIMFFFYQGKNKL